jgi:hypothetical protein
VFDAIFTALRLWYDEIEIYALQEISLSRTRAGLPEDCPGGTEAYDGDMLRGLPAAVACILCGKPPLP